MLVGKDGGVKARATKPEALDEFLDTIDRMPMRRAEIQRRVATVLAICMSSTFAAVTAAAQDQTETRIPVNFQNVDIYTLIETVSLHTGRNFIVDPRVRARVNVVSSEDVDADGLYQLFISVLARLDDEELVTEVVQLRTLVAQEVADALRPLLSASASISAESISNSIVITDHATNIERLLELISEMQ